ncbi:unnamed protein product [Thlaspi arvense]|uniref:RING-type E3 ubiquitin transferase n=1 Tax=Thlaspi arvense TaxID=13288 RepID=A0AAU9S6M5_THLAR|nr:unnamed protein product [Thlaspi arvense]
MAMGFLVDVMSHRRDSFSDAVHVIPTNDPPPDNRPGDSSVWATEDDYSRVLAANTDETESPSKKTRGSPSSSSFAEIGKSFFKTKLCCRFRAGTCPYDASSCHFAHSTEELRRPPLNGQETAGETREQEFKIPAESGRSYKGRHCKKFYSGEGCPYGESCTFLHDEASRNRESFAISLGPRGYGAGGDGGNVAQILRPPNWKTRVCNKWETTGYCPFGANCHFAHGASELHIFGGGLVEEEGKIGTSATCNTKQTGQADRVTSLVSPGVPSQRPSNAVTQKPNGVRTQRKWKGPDKISRANPKWLNLILYQTKPKVLGRFQNLDMASTTTTIPDADVFPTVSMPVTVVLTGALLFVIVAGFFALFFWRCLLNRLFSAWTLQRAPYGDLIHVTTPPEDTGLDPFIIRSFPVFLYSSATMKNYGTECAICLSEFSDEDTVRLITVCRHGFHSSCIDLWFELHKTCPVCRCELDPGLATDVNVKIKRRQYQTGSSVTFEENHPTTSSSKRLVEASAWRFSRSHSTGHFMVKTADVNVKIKGRHYQTGSCVSFDELTRYDEAAQYGMAW